ncbi:MAG: flagellar biosynthesis protein FlhB [Planctomycetes bacterium RBG_13_63_9]|nr:MAG: flagellar biosynthesis protein FlhB [Planctomycetes bacterium RBG_13_63_9]
MAENDADKSQDPTPHRRQKAREQGQVAKSQDLGSAVLLILGLACLMTLGGGLITFLGAYCERQLSGAAWLWADEEFVLQEWRQTLSALAGLLLPIFGVLFVGAVGINLLQIGPLFLPEKLVPDITRLDPIKGVQRLFSLANVVRLAFGIIKILVIAAVAFASLYNERDTILGLADREVPQIAAYMLHILFWTAVRIAVALLILALLDYGFQRWKYERDIKMTPQEVREEMKNLEGNPEITARRRHVQRQLALSRLSSAVPKADVVITNPTELAVAVEYEPKTMAAPIVVAKGAGVIAQRIRQLALEHGIPIVEKKPLAQALYREVDVDHPIPQDKYAAVAEVLAYVYQLQGKTISDHTADAA